MQHRQKSSKTGEPWATRIMAAIDGCGSSLRQFATDSGIPYQSLRAYAAGEKKPGLDAFTAIVIAADVSPAWLLMGEGEMRQHRATTKGIRVDGRILRRAIEELELASMRIKGQGKTAVTASLEALPLDERQYRALVAKEMEKNLAEVEKSIERAGEMAVYAATLYNLFAGIKDAKERNLKMREQAYELLTYSGALQHTAAGGTAKGTSVLSGAPDHSHGKRRKTVSGIRPRRR